MNPFNLLINYVIANSRASYYNVSGNQEVTNTALLTGMISENPLLSYLIIDNKAKTEGENSASPLPVIIPPATHGTPVLLPAESGTPQTPVKEEPPKETPLPDKGTVSMETFEAFKTEITERNESLDKTILKELSGLSKKMEDLDKEKNLINESIARIETRVNEIANTTQSANTKPTEADVKAQSKPNAK
jgi:hypothetical protein